MCVSSCFLYILQRLNHSDILSIVGDCQIGLKPSMFRDLSSSRTLNVQGQTFSCNKINSWLV